MKRREPPKSVLAHLETNEDYQALTDRLELLGRTQQILNEHWARLDLSVLAVRHENLLIGTPNAAVAAKCRQVEPSMIDRLKPVLPGLTRIRYRPRPKAAAAPAAPPSRKRPISDAALTGIDQAVAAMPDGTGRQALLRLLRRRQR